MIAPMKNTEIYKYKKISLLPNRNKTQQRANCVPIALDILKYSDPTCFRILNKTFISHQVTGPFKYNYIKDVKLSA